QARGDRGAGRDRAPLRRGQHHPAPGRQGAGAWGLRRDPGQGRQPHQGRRREDQLMPAAAKRPRWDILEEHLAEAAFLWEQWELALDAANYSLDEVAAGPEERLRAHLDALVL